jgi:hypothetical protein
VVFDGEETHYLEPIEEEGEGSWHTLHFHQEGKKKKQ